MDLLMLSLYNSRERDSDDWRSLFHQADSRFRFVDAVAVQGSTSGIIEAIWNP